jgi:hypothetical protein
MPNDDLPGWIRTITACVVLAIFVIFLLIFLAWFAQQAGVI